MYVYIYIYVCFFIMGLRGNAVGRGTALQVERSRVRLEFFILT